MRLCCLLSGGDEEFVDVGEVLAGGAEDDGIGGAGVEGDGDFELAPEGPASGAREGDVLSGAVDAELAGAAVGRSEGEAEF